MLTGAVGAGIGAAAGGALILLKLNQFGYQIVARTVMGGIAGGLVSQIYGGNFWQGFAQGAATAAAAFLFNETIHAVKQGAKGEWVIVATFEVPEGYDYNDFNRDPLTAAYEALGKHAARGFFREMDKIFENPVGQELGKNAPGQNPPQLEPAISIYQLLQGFYRNFKADFIRIIGPIPK
jgi:hypothetical protein